MWLYLYNLERIEGYSHQEFIPPDPELVSKYCEFRNKQRAGESDWPENFCQRAWIRPLDRHR